MDITKQPMRFATASVGLSLLGFTPAFTQATVVFDTTGSGTQYIDQQYGYNFYYIGDTATIAPTSEPLTTINIAFGTSSAGSAFTYTPDLTLDLYPNVTDALTETDLLGSAEVNNVTFTNDGVVDPSIGYNYEDQQLVTFDFTSQNIVLPTTFVFAYHDSAPLDSNGTETGAAGFSVALTSVPASVGTSDQAYFATYPDTDLDPADETLYPLGGNGPAFGGDVGLNIDAQVNVVPEPASFSLLGIGALALLRRRRRA